MIWLVWGQGQHILCDDAWIPQVPLWTKAEDRQVKKNVQPYSPSLYAISCSSISSIVSANSVLAAKSITSSPQNIHYYWYVCMVWVRLMAPFCSYSLEWLQRGCGHALTPFCMTHSGPENVVLSIPPSYAIGKWRWLGMERVHFNRTHLSLTSRTESQYLLFCCQYIFHKTSTITAKCFKNTNAPSLIPHQWNWIRSPGEVGTSEGLPK